MTKQRIAIDPGDAQWLAGLLEGEGCFWSRNPSGAKSGPLPMPAIKLAMTDEDVVARVADMVDLTYRTVAGRNENCQDQYQLNINGWKAVEVMELIRPHMGHRRTEKMDELLRSDWVMNPSKYHPR